MSAFPHDKPEMFMVECAVCECAMGKEYDNSAMPDFQYATNEEAIAAWNRRAPEGDERKG